MALTKREYVNNVTTITAENMNEIQDEIIRIGEAQETAGSGIHIGPEAPTDENVEVWIDTDEEVPESGGGIDVTAEAGQTIIVKAVDENGKPTEWESADYQPRTHWEEKDATVIQDETVLTFSDNMAMVQGLIPIVPGEVYTVYFDGVPYDCRCRRSSYMGYADYVLGNEGIIGAGLNTGEPFVVGVIPAMSAWGVFVPDTDLTHTIKITQSKINPLDIRYYDNSFCVTVTHESYTQEEGSTYSVKETAEEILRAYHNGKNMTCNLIVQKGKFAYEYFLALSKSAFMSDQGYGVVSLMFNGVYNQDYKIRVVSVNVPLVISPTLGIGDIIVDGYSTDAESFNPYVSA